MIRQIGTTIAPAVHHNTHHPLTQFAASQPVARRAVSEFGGGSEDPRRRTWSPATFNRMVPVAAGGVMGSGPGRGMRSYRSNDQLDDISNQVRTAGMIIRLYFWQFDCRNLGSPHRKIYFEIVCKLSVFDE